jgi:hypothetical protein
MSDDRETNSDKPKKPAPGYFRFRNKMLKEMDDDAGNKAQKIKVAWDELGEKGKE